MATTHCSLQCVYIAIVCSGHRDQGLQLTQYALDCTVSDPGDQRLQFTMCVHGCCLFRPLTVLFQTLETKDCSLQCVYMAVVCSDHRDQGLQLTQYALDCTVSDPGDQRLQFTMCVHCYCLFRPYIMSVRYDHCLS